MLDYTEITWFHSIDLGHGVVTNGHKSAELLNDEFERLQLAAADLRGKRVLDIGCNDGYMSLRCEQLGADVTGIDGIFRDGLKYVREHLNSHFQFYAIDLMSPSFRELGRSMSSSIWASYTTRCIRSNSSYGLPAPARPTHGSFWNPSTTTSQDSNEYRRSYSTMKATSSPTSIRPCSRR